MRLTTRELDYSHGFTHENDIFNRQRFATQLENIIINSQDESLVFAIDDGWGSGKTTFLRLWESSLNKKEPSTLKAIYFDAFENDYQQDAFLAIASKIYSLIEKKEPELQKRFIDGAKAVGKSLLGISAKVGISIATAGLVNGTAIESAGDSISDGLSDPIDKFIEDKIKNAEKDELTLVHFKETLQKVAENKKVVFIIDELDRARPDFSLEILEKIKHVFSTNNFVFILSMNREQFQKVIVRRYGEIDAKLYLSKFIHHWFTLPKEPVSLTNKAAVGKYCEHLSNTRFGNNGSFQVACHMLSHLLSRNEASLRDAERAFGFMSLISASQAERKSETEQVAIAIVTYIISHHPGLVQRIKNRNISPDELMSSLGLSYPSNFEEDNHIMIIINTELLTDDDYRKMISDGTPLVLHSFGRRPFWLRNVLSHVDNMFIDNN
ncbi:KAP family P-loop NTPase fold protein [Serratia marcescens]|uniref:KAP family P-loop NTPase fold protein n=1 Tax=Serratia marcescens TaxID=615 RepID=UPI00332813E3